MYVLCMLHKKLELDILNKYRVTFCWNIEHIFNSKIDMHHLNYLCLVNLNQLPDAMITASDNRIVFASKFHVKNKSVHILSSFIQISIDHEKLQSYLRHFICHLCILHLSMRRFLIIFEDSFSMKELHNEWARGWILPLYWLEIKKCLMLPNTMWTIRLPDDVKCFKSNAWLRTGTMTPTIWQWDWCRGGG